MEEVDAAGRVGKVSLCADIDPPGTIPGNDLDLLPLLQGKSLAEEAEGLQAVASWTHTTRLRSMSYTTVM